MPAAPIKVLLIEDDPEDAFLTRRILTASTACRFEVVHATSLAEGLELLGEDTDAILLDLTLPDVQGWDTFVRFKDAAPHTPIILLTGCEDEELGLRAVNEGAQDYIPKGTLAEAILERCVRYAIQRKKTEETLARIAEELRDRNDQVAEELELARDMQHALLPQRYPCFPGSATPDASAIEFAHLYRPSRFLGGDFFDIDAVSDTEACVFICDVMGHGVRSALVAATIRGLLEEMESSALDPGMLLTELGRALRVVTKRPGQLLFASAACLLLDLVRARVTYAVAGHPPPIHLAPDGTADWLDLGGKSVEPALGIFAGQRFTTFSRDIREGDRFLLFTDGLQEVEGPDGEQYGKQRIIESAESNAALPLRDLVACVVKKADMFAVDPEARDDACMVGIAISRLLNPKG